VNNAGTAIPKTFEETTLEEMDRVIDINVRGTLAATQAALKHMKSGGRIISIGSAVGERVQTPGLVAYSATKGAVKIFTQALSRELGSRGITVNNVQPGPIDTDLNPASGDWAVPQKAATALDRYGHADEVAAVVAFVAGPESSYITGSNLTVDGGMNACPRNVVEHEARTSRHAATKERLYREHILHIWAYRCAWGFCLCRQQTCGGGTHEVGGSRSGRDGRASECHRPRTNRNTNAEPLHENRRGKDWFGLDRAAKARGKTRGNCSSYRFCFLPQSLLNHGSFLPRRRRQNRPIDSPAGGTQVRDG
jgi:hypothetical protein